MGQQAYRFVDFLKSTHQSWWQLLPIGPTLKYGNPYCAYTSFGGNPTLISLDLLKDQGLLDEDLSWIQSPQGLVNYEITTPLKLKALKMAYTKFKKVIRKTPFFDQYVHFVARNMWWLKDFAVFSCLTDDFGPDWTQWPLSYKKYDQKTADQYFQNHSDEVFFHYFTQWIFFEQWSKLKSYANKNGIKILGDIPIFVDKHSLDVWKSPDHFKLDQEGRPLFVSGAPPDAFCDMGQVWNTPVFDWKVHRKNHYRWWKMRLRYILELFDVTRIDHFRGLESYWEIPNTTPPDARKGKWVKAHGRELFKELEKLYPELPLVVEDLGDITKAVLKLRDDFEFPGMKILHFAFGSGKNNPYLPPNIPQNSIIYTGTHDNDTTQGWFKNLKDKNELMMLNKFIKTDPTQIHWQLIQLAHESRSNLCIIPMADILGLDSKARINLPGTEKGNWMWRFDWDQLNKKDRERLKTITIEAKRG